MLTGGNFIDWAGRSLISFHKQLFVTTQTSVPFNSTSLKITALSTRIIFRYPKDHQHNCYKYSKNLGQSYSAFEAPLAKFFHKN